jgi:hypothetical protein
MLILMITLNREMNVDVIDFGKKAFFEFIQLFLSEFTGLESVLIRLWNTTVTLFLAWGLVTNGLARTILSFRWGLTGLMNYIISGLVVGIVLRLHDMFRIDIEGYIDVEWLLRAVLLVFLHNS